VAGQVAFDSMAQQFDWLDGQAVAQLETEIGGRWPLFLMLRALLPLFLKVHQ
jgi:hypothetical protein